MKKDRYGRARVLSTAELDLLLEALPENHRVLATLLRRTAARVSEGLQLKWRFVADGYVLLTATTTKGGKKTRSVPIHPQLAAELAAWKQGATSPCILLPIPTPTSIIIMHPPYQHLSRIARPGNKQTSAESRGIFSPNRDLLGLEEEAEELSLIHI